MLKQIISYILLLLFPSIVTDAPSVQSPSVNVELPIVMYHHMSPSPKLWGSYVISPEQFERDLKYLTDNGYTSITTRQLLGWYNGQSILPEKPVLITFDDGYESTLVRAAPILEKYGMTAVVAVIGSVAEQYSSIPDHTLVYSHMSWEAVAEADSAGVLEMQCHTYDMHKLATRRGCGRKYGESSDNYRLSLISDIEKFQEQFELATGRKADVMALPFGFYTDSTISILAEKGFRIVFTCTENINHLTGDPKELLFLCRFNRPSGPDSSEFFSKWSLTLEK